MTKRKEQRIESNIDSEDDYDDNKERRMITKKKKMMAKKNMMILTVPTLSKRRSRSLEPGS